MELRFGALYALERIAQDSERDHIPIMEIICAYIRENTKADGYAENNTDKLREDIQTAISILARRSPQRCEYERDASGGKHAYALGLRDCLLMRISTTKARFAYARLDGANLTEAQLYKANLTEADFAASFCQHLAAKSDFSKCVNLSQEQVDQMFGDATTVLPNGLAVPAHGSKEELKYGTFLNAWQTHIKNTS